MLRLGLFFATNIAVMIVLAIAMQVFGLHGVLASNGVDLDLTALLIISGVVGMSGSLISLALSKRMALMSTGAKVIEAPRTSTEQWLMQTVSRQAEAAGIGMPDVAIYPAQDINAFATGMNRNNALVAVSEGLLRGMNEHEAEAVLAHEISHVANGDMVTLSLVQGVVNTFVFFLSRVIGHVVDRVVFKVERGHGPAFWITAMIAQVVLGILASAIVMWFSRFREYRADAGGARLAGRQKMIAALERLKSMHEPAQLPDQLQAFGISGGLGGGLKALFMSHPPLDDRIEALRRSA